MAAKRPGWGRLQSDPTPPPSAAILPFQWRDERSVLRLPAHNLSAADHLAFRV
jgi:hypothetical protein